MNRQRMLTWALAGLLVTVLATQVYAGWWDSLADAKPVKLEELIKDPHGWKGKEISFVCTFHKVSTIFNPYYTRFVPDDYVNFAAWPLSRKLWVKEEYLETHKFLFMEKDHPQYEKLMDLDKFTRIRVTGFVQSSFKNTPWIEVRHIKVLSGGITKDALKSIILGDRAAAKKQWKSAMGHYDRAAGMSLPEEVEASISKKRATTLHRMGKHELARKALAPALDYDPKDTEALALLLQMKKPTPAAVAAPDEVGSGKGEVVVKPVDPKKYSEEPKAMPVPEKQPVVEEPAKVQPAKLPTELPEEKPAVVKEDPEVVEPPAKVDAPEVEKPKVVKEDPVDVPEAKDEPVKRKRPKKRMAGPM